MLLEAYALSGTPQPLVPAPPRRDWMDGFTDGHAYRCLPLTVGNTYGWQLLLPVDVVVQWNGRHGGKDVVIQCQHPYQAVSNFKRGVVTFDVAYIFRTPPGYHLLVTGPSNRFKDGAAPMTAVIESDWVPYSFTFNYQLTRPGEVRWSAGEPYAQICVVPAGLQEDVQPVIRGIEANPQLADEHEAWRARREELSAARRAGDPAASWGKDYFLGRYADGRPTEARHVNKLRLRNAIDERGGT